MSHLVAHRHPPRSFQLKNPNTSRTIVSLQARRGRLFSSLVIIKSSVQNLCMPIFYLTSVYFMISACQIDSYLPFLVNIFFLMTPERKKGFFLILIIEDTSSSEESQSLVYGLPRSHFRPFFFVLCVCTENLCTSIANNSSSSLMFI